MRAWPGFVLAGLLLAAPACGDSQVTVVVVTFQTPTAPAGVVPAAKTLTVKVSNAGTTIMQMYMSGPIGFPTSLSVTPHERTGPLDIDAVAVADEPLARSAHGIGSVPIKPNGRADLTVMLLPDDYTLNSRRTGLQSPTYSAGLEGRQVGAADDGSIAIIYEDSCPQAQRCDIWGRLFDAGGKPRTNQIIGDDTDFIANSTSVGTTTHPALAVSPSGAFAAGWKLFGMGMPTDLRARVFQRDGMPVATEFSLLSSTMANRDPDDVMVAGRPTGTFLVVWSQERSFVAGMPQPLYIHARAVRADGTLLPAFTVNDPNPAMPNPHANDDHLTPFIAVAADNSFAVTWVRGASNCHDAFDPNGCEVRVRFYDAGGGSSGEMAASSQPTTHAVTPVLAALPTGWLVVWNDKLTTGADTDDLAIVARRFDRMGRPTTSDFVVNTIIVGPQSQPAVAALADGSALVAWTDPSMRGEDMDSLAIRGRALRPFGLPAGNDFPINTTTARDQYRASVAPTAARAFFALWADESGQPPDPDGDVRGRFLFPDFGRKDGVVGAQCGSASPCGSGLLCAPAIDGQSYCHVACTQTGVDCPTGGKCAPSSGPDGGNVCTF